MIEGNVEMLVMELADQDYLTCPVCKTGNHIVLYMISIWQNKGLCEKCCYKWADRDGFEIIGDQRKEKK